MKRSRFTEEQVIGILREQEAGGKTEEICHKHWISQTTFYKWKAKYVIVSREEDSVAACPRDDPCWSGLS